MREEIYKIITYHGDDGTSGYLLSDEKVSEILSLVKSKLMEAMPKEKEIKELPSFHQAGEYYVGEHTEEKRGYNQALKDYQDAVNKLL